MSGDGLRSFVEAMPKVELHVHLEGSIRPETLLELARRRGVTLPADDAEGLRRWFEFRDFEHFVEIYLTCCRCLRDPEDFQLAARQFLDSQERQQVIYSEVHFTIGTHLANGANGGEVADALAEVCAEGDRRGFAMRLIPDIVRNVGVEQADRTLEWALEGRDKGVVALGLSGFESEPDDPFAAHFKEAEAAGLGITAHAGETQGPEAIRSVLEVARAQRIGHGVRAVEDPALVEELVRRRIPLEVCPTSNLCLGVAPDLESHPFAELDRAGAVLTVNSDDPPFFGTSLTEELIRLVEALSFDWRDMVEWQRNALASCFLNGGARDRLAQVWEERLSEVTESSAYIQQSTAAIDLKLDRE